MHKYYPTSERLDRPIEDVLACDCIQWSKKDFDPFFYLYKTIKKEGFNKQGVTSVVKSQQDLKDPGKRVQLYAEFQRITITDEANKASNSWTTIKDR